MSKIDSLCIYLHEPGKLVLTLGSKGLLNWMSDEAYIKLLFRGYMGKKPDLKHPKTFNEKLQWLKLYDHREEYTNLVDKLEAKIIIGQKIGDEHIVPIYGKWGSADEIPFEELPDQFVLKCNHDQGSTVLVPDKSKADRKEIISFLNYKLSRSTYPGTREYPYKNIPHYVFAEKYLQDDIIDYKFYCFQGEPRFLYCGMGMIGNHQGKVDYYDLDWKPMPFYRTDYERLGEVPRPACLQEMIDIARALSKGVPFVRIDLFEVSGRIYFSEFTLCPASGVMRFVPEEYDRITGDWLILPKCGKKDAKK